MSDLQLEQLLQIVEPLSFDSDSDKVLGVSCNFVVRLRRRSLERERSVGPEITPEITRTTYLHVKI